MDRMGNELIQPQFRIRSGEVVDCAHIDLDWGQGVDRQAGEEVDKSIDGRAGAAVLQSHPLLQLGQEGLEDESFSQQQLVQ